MNSVRRLVLIPMKTWENLDEEIRDRAVEDDAKERGGVIPVELPVDNIIPQTGVGITTRSGKHSSSPPLPSATNPTTDPTTTTPSSAGAPSHPSLPPPPEEEEKGGKKSTPSPSSLPPGGRKEEEEKGGKGGEDESELLQYAPRKKQGKKDREEIRRYLGKWRPLGRPNVVAGGEKNKKKKKTWIRK